MENTNQTFDLVETKNIPTELELRKLRRQYVTVMHPTVASCGHKFSGEPTNNCQDCWFAFFQHFGELTKTADNLFQEHGKDALIAVRGEKFTKNFTRFMSTLANTLKEVKTERINDQSNSGD